MDFVREATQQLDTLTAVFEESKHAAATTKALQFAEVANSAAATQKILPPGVVSGLYGEIASSNGFEVHLEPPQLATQDVQDQLDAVMEVEEAKQDFRTRVCCSVALAYLLEGECPVAMHTFSVGGGSQALANIFFALGEACGRGESIGRREASHVECGEKCSPRSCAGSCD